MTSPTLSQARSFTWSGHSLRRIVSTLLITLSLAVLLIASLTPALAYDEEGIPFYDPLTPTHPQNADQQVSSIHFDLVGSLALAAGFSEEDAATLQLYSQLTDSSVLSTTDTIYNFDADPANWPQPPSVKDVPASPDCPSPQTTTDSVTMGGTGLVECPGCFTSRMGPYGVFFHMAHDNPKELGAIRAWAMGDAAKLTAQVTWGYSSTVPFTWEPAYTIANIANIYEATACFTQTTVEAVDTGSTQPGSLAALGVYLHALGDHWSHQECIQAADSQGKPFAAHVTVKGPQDPLWPCRWLMHNEEFGDEAHFDSARTYSGTVAIYDALLAYAGSSSRPIFQPIPRDVEGGHIDNALKNFANTAANASEERRSQAQALAQWVLWTRFNDPAYANGAITSGTGDAANATAYVPSAASSAGTVQVTLTANDEHAAAAGERLVGSPVRITASAGSRVNITQFDKPISLKIGYSQSDAQGKDESTLLLHRWDEMNGRWVAILSNRDSTANELIGSTSLTGDFALLFAAQAVVAASYFDTGREGWRVDGDVQAGSGIPAWLPGAGHPGGHLRATDDVQGGTWYWVAPEKFLGDASAAYSQTLRFDLRQDSDMSNQFNWPDVIIRGSASALIYNTAFNPRLVWSEYSIPLTEDAGWMKIGLTEPISTAVGVRASAEEIKAVLQDVRGLHIRGEFESGADEGFLDNVVLGGAANNSLIDAVNGVKSQWTVGDLSLLIEFPSGAVSETLSLRIGGGPGHSAPDGMRQIGNGFSIEAYNGQGEPVHQFLQAYTITLSTARVDHQDFHIFSPRLAYWDESESAWKSIPTSYDPTSGVLIATLDHLTQFAIFGEIQSKVYLPMTTR
ncbi:MAG: hypothetical protein KJZ86_27700 [Caldilineaceae bacterium]|nr:hypothetical protein [Caldilineaceae bacterium]